MKIVILDAHTANPGDLDWDNPLLAAKNCLITPHIAWATQEARKRLIEVAGINLAAFIAGQPANVVN